MHQPEAIYIDPRPFDYSSLDKEAQDFDMYWSEFYPDAVKDIPSPRPCVPDDDPTNTSNLPKVQLSAYVDADHAHDQATPSPPSAHWRIRWDEDEYEDSLG